jgi:hypothetical protein
VQIAGGGGTVSPNYNGQALTTGKSYTLTAKPKGGFAFTGWSGDFVSSQPKLTFTLSSDVALTASFKDNQAPTVKIMPVPKDWSTNSTSNAVYTVTGTAKDNGTITNVYVKVNNGAWQPANTGNNWSTWWLNVTLTPNANTIYAYAVDSDGNVSKTTQLKVTYSAAQPNLYYPIQATMVVTDSEDEVVDEATFAEKKFSDVTGVGTYTYKKTGPVTGKLTMKYTAPPSAVNKTNDVNVTLLYNTYYSGTFAEISSLNFGLYKTYNWATPSLTGAILTFTDGITSDQSVLTFPKQPALGANASIANAPNPLVIQLGAAYPGQIGDRVNVTFLHTRKENGSIKNIATPTDAGTVIDTNANTIKVLFDSPSSAKTKDPLVPTGVSIVSYYYQDYSGEEPGAGGTGTFTYTNYTWVGSLLQLNQSGQNKYVVLTFTNETTSGVFYDESYLPDSTYATTYGAFELALPPQIIIQPQTFGWTNGGSASFTVQAAGTPVLAYQWLFNGTNLTDGFTGSGSLVAGSTTTNLTITGLTTNDQGNYSVVVTNNYGSVTSSNAGLVQAIAPQIIIQPQQNTTVFSGQAFSLDVTAIGSAPLAYRWQANGTNLTDGLSASNSVVQGSKTPHLSLSSVTITDSGSYQVIITNSFGSVTSSVANVNITPSP